MQSITLKLGTITAALTFSSCAIVTTPVKIVGKVATTSVGVVGKAAGAGFDAMSGGDDEEKVD